MAKQRPTTTRLVSSLERAIAVLGVLADSPTDLGTNEIARRVGINASSVSRLLATLVEEEFVRRMPDTGRYRLGPRLIELGNTALSRIDLRELARPRLVTLSEVTGETATISVPGEQTAITVDFVPSRSTVRSVAQLGRQSVLHATAIGKVVLAHGANIPAEPLTAYTRHTITDAAELAREVAQVRERGWAEAMREREDDLNAVAVPVLDPTGTLVAILGLQGPAGRFDRRAMRTAVDQLRDHADRLSSPSALSPGAVH